MQKQHSDLIDSDTIVISHSISRELHHNLSKEIEKNKKHDNCRLFLTTYGGDPDAGYRIGRCLRHYYKHIRLIVPSFCKSAGTLIAIAADELAIGDLGELGPLDVQIKKHNEFLESNSGLDLNESMMTSLNHVMSAFRYALVDIKQGTRISTKLAGELATQLASSIAQPLYAQIDPMRLGETQRMIAIAIEYGKRLNNMSDNLQNEESLYSLVSDYPSHGFVIDRKEAGDIFKNVSHPSDEEKHIIESLWSVLQQQTEITPIFLSGGEINESEQTESANRSHNQIDEAQPTNNTKKSNGSTGRKNGRSSKNNDNTPETLIENT